MQRLCLGGRFWLEKIDRSCVITDLKQASCFWRITLCFGTLTLAPVGEGVICFLKKVYSGILLGVFLKKNWGCVLFPTVYSGILLGGQKLLKQCYFSTAYSGILLRGQNLLRQCSCSNSLLRYSFGRLKTDEAMLFFNSWLRYSVGRSTTEAVFFFQKFILVFFWEVWKLHGFEL